MALDLVFCLMRALALEGPLYRTIRGYRAAEAGVPKKRLPTALQVLLRKLRCRFVTVRHGSSAVSACPGHSTQNKTRDVCAAFAPTATAAFSRAPRPEAHERVSARNY